MEGKRKKRELLNRPYVGLWGRCKDKRKGPGREGGYGGWVEPMREMGGGGKKKSLARGQNRAYWKLGRSRRKWYVHPGEETKKKKKCQEYAAYSGGREENK